MSSENIMDHLYHAVPPNMQGTVLYPLNVLKEKMPEVYKLEVRKYDGREQTLTDRIPTLGCLWNDVLHFTAVPPADLQKALMESGRPEMFHKTFFQIDPHLLDPHQTTIYLYEYSDAERKSNPDSYAPYNAGDIKGCSGIPDVTREYFKDRFKSRKKPLLYYRVPHILYHGALDVTDILRVSV
ncbi:MAG: hypothetical protein WA001_04990 [Patescibacteria group bacterium]